MGTPRRCGGAQFGNTWGTWQRKFNAVDCQMGTVPVPLVITGQMQQKGCWL
jgi:hypothetical protein